MAGLSDIVDVSITASTRTPTRAGFGTPLLMGYHTVFPELSRRYSDVAELAEDGFDTFSPIYRMAQALMSQDPAPAEFVVGRLPSAHAHTQILTITSAVEGQHIRLTVVDPTTGDETDIDYTVLNGASTTTVATAVEALIEAVTGVASAASSAEITITPVTSGHVVYVHSLENCTIKDTTADYAADTALTALQAYDDDWYAVLLDVNSTANIMDVAAWVQPKVKMFLCSTANSEEAAGSGTLGSDLVALSYTRTVGLFSRRPDQYIACALAGRVLPQDPGSITWAFKELIGVSADVLTTAQESALLADNWNTYQSIAGLPVTRNGKRFDGGYPDERHGIDWLTARIQERVFALLANAGKLPYTDASVDIVRGEILAALGVGVDRGFLVAGSLTCTGPRVSAVSSGDKAARLLPDIKFGADLAGAIHKVTIRGTLAV